MLQCPDQNPKTVQTSTPRNEGDHNWRQPTRDLHGRQQSAHMLVLVFPFAGSLPSGQNAWQNKWAMPLLGAVATGWVQRPISARLLWRVQTYVRLRTWVRCK
eukprot:3472255-Amphidinium_carterae.1